MTDPVTLEVLRNALQSVAEEMGAVLTRTALSPNIRDRRDCSTALYTPAGDLVAQAEHIPLHLGLMPAVVKEVLKHFPMEELVPGDAVIINDPYVSGSHLPDICVVSPVFFDGLPLAVTAGLAHHVDVGGAVPGSMSTTATEIFQEGLRIPPVKICRAGRVERDLLKVLAHNVRTAAEFRGDVQAQLSANRKGEQRLLELARKVGAAALRRYMEAIIEYGERRLAAGVRAIPAGTYRFTDYLEGDGLSSGPIGISVALEVGDGRIKADFTGTSAQVPGPVNATRGVTSACVYFAVTAVADPELPSSEGITRVVEVVTPPGTLVNPHFPAPVAHANINTAQRITDVVLGALAQAVPGRVTAAGTGSMSNLTIGDWDGGGRCYSYVETYGGGQGAKSDQDGMDGVHVNMTNTLNTPVEVIEMNYPLRVERYGLLPDSGGAGRYRGGTGMVREITVLGDAVVSVSTERNTLFPWGLDGGAPGRGSRCLVAKPGTAAQPAPGKFTAKVAGGTALILETAGGGGFGRPFTRSPAAVRRDVIDGLVSRAAALTDYGVVLDDALEVDAEKTAALRKSRT